jgi:hypothetical protein
MKINKLLNFKMYFFVEFVFIEYDEYIKFVYLIMK